MSRLARLLVVLLVAMLLNGRALAAGAGMRVFQINDHLICFYLGRPAQDLHRAGAPDWTQSGALDVGVATYVIHSGDQALVYDSFPSVAPARWVRDYLVKAGIRHFTLVNSHWHLDHVGGNAVYADTDRIATEAAMQQLVARRTAIEAGTEWGLPAIKPLVAPNIGITADTVFYVGGIRVDLRPVQIHSDDGLVIYLPADRILLAGDTLEDTVTFISEPEHVVAHYANMRKLKTWDIGRIYPNHGNPDVISTGGYSTTLIDATLVYLRQVILRSHDAGYTSGSLQDYVGDSVKKGWVSVWWAYEPAHRDNLSRVAAAMKDKALPELPW
jgi:cyclase